jgi:hypothetical protein
MPDFNQLISKIQRQTLQAGNNSSFGLQTNTPFLGENKSFETPISNKLNFEEITPYKLDTVYDTLSDGTRVARYENYIPGTDNNERLAQKQTLTEKWGNGVAKLGIKTGTAVIGGTLGIVDSIGTLISKGSLSEAYNSNLNVILDDFNKKVDYKLPNLYTQQDRDAGFFEQTKQANFYADKLFGGFSFLTGAVISEAIWSAATAATFGGTSELLALNTAKQAEKGALWATKAFGTEKKLQSVLNTAKSWVKAPTTSVLEETGNVMRGISNFEKKATVLNYGIGKGVDIIVPMMRSAGYESGMEARLYMKQTEDNWLEKYREVNGREPSSEEYARFKDKLSDSGNLVFGANMAILSLSNYAQLKSTILGKTTSKTLKNNAWDNVLFGRGFTKDAEGILKATDVSKSQKIFGKVYGLGKGFLTEGQEEMSQSVFSGTGENYMLAEFNKDKTKSSYGLMESFTDSLRKTYSTKEGLTEGFIGGLIGILGGTSLGLKNKIKGGEFFESETKQRELEDAIQYSNEYTAKSLVNNIVASNKIMQAQELRDKAISINDIPGEKLAEASMSILRLQRDNNIGGFKEGLKDYSREVNALSNDFIKEELGFKTDEEVNNYKDSLIENHNNIAKKYITNLKYSQSLLGEKDINSEDFKNISIESVHDAMAQTLTLGEIARKTDNELTSIINEEILKQSGGSELVDANNIQDILEKIPQEKNNTIKKLVIEKRNLTTKLKTLHASLTKLGKIKTLEKTTERPDKLIEITNKIQETQNLININQEQSKVALQGLGIEEYDNGIITFEAFENQEKNVLRFNNFMQDLSKTNPKQYSKILGLLAQKNKSIQHIKNYQRAIDLISDKNTRLKTVQSWIKKTNLKTDGKQFYLDILKDLNENQNIILEDKEVIENRNLFKESEKVSEDYIKKLLEKDYNGLLQEDKIIVDKYTKNNLASMTLPQSVNEVEQPTPLEILKNKVKELTKDIYTTEYIEDILLEQNRKKPKNKDIKEYEDLLSKWNKKAESKLFRILSRPSNYNYRNLGLNEIEIDRLKELNSILGKWMSFQGIDAGKGESVADLIERINSLENIINYNETYKIDEEKDFEIILGISDEEFREKNNSYTRGGQTQVQALRSIVNGNYRWSHISPELFASYFSNVKELLKNELGFSIILQNNKIINATYNDKGGFDTTKEDWESVKEDSLILVKNFGTISSAINKFIGLDSQGNEQYEISNGNSTYLQTDGRNIQIDSDEVNNTKLGDTIQLAVSTTDKYNSENDKIENYHIYMYRNGKLIGNVPANYTTSEEKADGIGLPLLQLRKNAKEYVSKQISEGKVGLIQLPYTLKAGVVFIGQPNLTLQKDKDGVIKTKNTNFTKESLQLIKGQGYIINGEITSNSEIQVKQFISKLSLKNKDKKIPFVVFDYLGKNVAFPVDLISENNPQGDLAIEILNDINISNSEKINKFIELLKDNNFNPNDFDLDYSDSENFNSQPNLKNAIKKLDDVKKVIDLEDFVSKNYKVEDLIKDATIALEIDKTPFLTSKIMVSISDEITDLSVPLEIQKEDLINQEIESVKKLSNFAKTLKQDILNNNQVYENIEGKYTDNLVSEIDIPLQETNFIQNQSITKYLEKALFVESKNLSGEITRVIKLPKIIRDRLGKPLLNSIKNEFENLEKIKEKLKSLKIEIKNKDLEEQVKKAKECP